MDYKKNQSGKSNPTLLGMIIAFIGVLLAYLYLQKIANKPAAPEPEEKEPEVIALQSLEAQPSEVNIKIGDEIGVQITFTPSDATNKETDWISFDSSIAAASKGKITGISQGSTMVFIRSSEEPGISDTVVVHVMDTVKAPVDTVKKKVPIKKIPDKKKSEKKIPEKKIPEKKIIKKEISPEKKEVKVPEEKSEKKVEEKNKTLGLLKIISSPPFASIQVNGLPWGETPMKKAKEVVAGSVKIKVRHRLFPTKDSVIQIIAGQEKMIKFNLKDGKKK